MVGTASAIAVWLSQRSFPIFILLVGLAYTALGFYFIIDLLNERVCAQKMLQALERGGDSLAWIFIENEHGQREACLLHYCFTDRRRGSLYGTTLMIREVFDFFCLSFPQLSTGYSAELKKRFQRDPHSLKTLPVRLQMEKETRIEDNPSNGW